MTERIHTHAPIQTRPSTRDKQERYLALLAAEVQNRIKEAFDGKQRPRVDVWNTIGSKVDREYQIYCASGQTSPLTRREFNFCEIEARYHLLEEKYDFSREGRVVLRDDDDQYQEIVSVRLRRFIEEGIFLVREDRFWYCEGCDYTIVPTAVDLKACPNCQNKDLKTVTKKGLFLELTGAKKEEIVNSIMVNPKVGIQNLRRRVSTMPPLLQLSRQRDYGLSLEEFGVDPTFVLDPKMMLTMMIFVFEEMGIGSLATMYQGIDSIGNFAPYAFLIAPKHRIKYVTLGLVSPFSSERVNEGNKGFYGVFLPLILPSFPKGIDDEGKLRLFKEYSRTVRQFQYALSNLRKLTFDDREGVEETVNLSLEIPREVFELFLGYRTREAFSALRQFIYHRLSREYLDLCRKCRVLPRQEDLKNLEQALSLFYGIQNP